MRTVIPTLLVVSALLAATPHAVTAVNCDQVRRYLSTGRSVEDIADNMIVSVDDVKKCQQAGTGEQKPAPTPGKATAPYNK